jgi:hypothetical protein
MMKNTAWLRGSGFGLAAVINADTKIGFLSERQEGIDLAPAGPAQEPAYVWKRVFLRAKGGHRS